MASIKSCCTDQERWDGTTVALMSTSAWWLQACTWSTCCFLGARLDDLLLPWRFDLQHKHRIDHPGLLEQMERFGVGLL